MKDLISNINKLFESRVRLGIMSVLMVNENYDFNSLKKALNVTDENPIRRIRLPSWALNYLNNIYKHWKN